MDTRRPRIIAICLFRRDDRVLVAEIREHGRLIGYRPLGGGVEFGEHSRATVEREIHEELGADVAGLDLLTVIENHFTYEGREHHEVVFVYDGAFADATLYGQQVFTYSDGAAECRAVWRSLADFDEHTRLFPDGLLAYLRKAR